MLKPHKTPMLAIAILAGAMAFLFAENKADAQYYDLKCQHIEFKKAGFKYVSLGTFGIFVPQYEMEAYVRNIGPDWYYGNERVASIWLYYPTRKTWQKVHYEVLGSWIVNRGGNLDPNNTFDWLDLKLTATFTPKYFNEPVEAHFWVYNDFYTNEYDYYSAQQQHHTPWNNMTTWYIAPFHWFGL